MRLYLISREWHYNNRLVIQYLSPGCAENLSSEGSEGCIHAVFFGKRRKIESNKVKKYSLVY